MSTIQNDFDRIALTEVSTDGATHNDHYHSFLLRHLPTDCHNVLEIGCGTGAFARRLAERAALGAEATRIPTVAALGAQASCLLLAFRYSPSTSPLK